MDASLTIKLPKKLKDNIRACVIAEPEVYMSINHFARCAIIKLVKEKERGNKENVAKPIYTKKARF